MATQMKFFSLAPEVLLLLILTRPDGAFAFDNAIPLGGPGPERTQVGASAPQVLPSPISRPSPLAPELPPGKSSEVTPEQKQKLEKIAQLKKKIAEKAAKLAAIQKAQDDQLKKQIEEMKNAPR